MGAPNPPAQQTASKLSEAVVAPGRTVVDAEGVTRKPGEVAQLAHVDVKRLRGLGFLLEKDADFIVGQAGPKVSASDGPTVRLA